MQMLFLTQPASQAQLAPSTLATSYVVPPYPFWSQPIPHSFFGNHLEYLMDWPAGYVGSLGKAVAATWPYLEPSKGVYNWSRLDAYVAAAEKNGVSIFYSNGGVPAWASTNTSSCYSGENGTKVCTSGVTNIQDWDDFVTALVTRYNGKIQMFELWNEPNATTFTGTVAEMVTLTNHEYAIIRALDPKALIASPSATTAWLNEYWAAGGERNVDIVTLHSYPNPTNPVAEVICAFRTQPLKDLMVKYGIDKPIWDTEGSWGKQKSLSNADLQAAFASRFMVLHWACGVERFYWYLWDGADKYPYWGNLWTPLGPTEAGVAFKVTEGWLRGATMPNGCLMNGASIPPPPAVYHGIYTCNITRPNGYSGQMVWNTDGSSTFTAAVGFIRYRDLAGNVYPVPSTHKVTIGLKPILLEN